MPTVDFNVNMVLAVFAGNRPSGCYSMEIKNVVLDSAGITVNYHESVFTGDGVICVASITYPSHIVSVPASTAPVRFVAV